MSAPSEFLPKEWEGRWGDDPAQHQSAREGWAIHSFQDTRHMAIRRLEGVTRFASDREVWNHVWRRAGDGSEYHSDALVYLAVNSPVFTAVLLARCAPHTHHHIPPMRYGGPTS